MATARDVAAGSRWQQWVEPWYIAYALLGATFAGMIPILLPLAASRGGSAAGVGLVMAMLNLGGLSAPLWGSLADRYRAHRWLLAGGLLALFLGLLLFPLTSNAGAWLALALLQGAGAVGSGWAAATWGYGAPAALAVAGVAIGLVLVLRLPFPAAQAAVH